MNILFSCIGKRGYIASYFRPLLAAGDRLLGTGNTPWTPGFAQCDEAFLMPDIGAPGYAEAVLDLCVRQDVDALFSLNDIDVAMLAPHRGKFEAAGVKMLIPRAEAAGIAFDKYRTYTFLSGQGIKTPRTALAPVGAREFGLPLVVKPRNGSGSRDTFIVRRIEDLDVYFNHSPDMIVQEFVQGSEFDIELCGDLDGEPIGFSCWNKHLSRQGETERAETFHDPAIQALGLELGRLMKVAGPMDIDLIRRGDEIFVLEFNPRFGGGYPASHLAGADFPGLLMQVIRSGHAAQRIAYRGGVIMMKQLQPFGGVMSEVRRNVLHVSDDA